MSSAAGRGGDDGRVENRFSFDLRVASVLRGGSCLWLSSLCSLHHVHAVPTASKTASTQIFAFTRGATWAARGVGAGPRHTRRWANRSACRPPPKKEAVSAKPWRRSRQPQCRSNRCYSATCPRAGLSWVGLVGLSWVGAAASGAASSQGGAPVTAEHEPAALESRVELA